MITAQEAYYKTLNKCSEYNNIIKYIEENIQHSIERFRFNSYNSINCKKSEFKFFIKPYFESLGYRFSKIKYDNNINQISFGISWITI